MSEFPLFRILIVALIDVLKCLNPIELFDLSQLSKTSTALIKLVGTKNFHLSMSEDCIAINHKYHFVIVESFDPNFYNQLGTRVFHSIEAQVLEPKGRENIIKIVWRHRTKGVINTMLHLVNLFGCPIRSYYKSRNNPGFTSDYSKHYRTIMSTMMKTQGGIRRLEIPPNCFEHSDNSWTMENVKGVEEFISADYSSIVFNFLQNLKLLDTDSYFIGMEHLLVAAKSCEAILLRYSELTWENLNEFMKAWKSGEFSNLQCLRVYSKQLNKEEGQILGFTGGELERDARALDKWRMIRGLNFQMAHGVEIQRDDGVRGMMGLHCNSTMFVLNTL